MRKIPLTEAVGLPLAHDITEIRPEKGVKHRAFKRGHVVTEDDLERLRDLGKNYLYITGPEDTDVHEDDAALTVAPLAAGVGIDHEAEPCEGKIAFRARHDGVFRVDADRLLAIHRLAIPALPTLPGNYPVRKGQTVAAFRIIPLTCERAILDAVVALLGEPLLRVDPFIVRDAAILVTGTEVYEGRIEDGFIPRLTAAVAGYDVPIATSAVVPDDRAVIASHIEQMAAQCGLVMVTGGTSVDPDDVTTAAMRDAGVEFAVKGMPVQPGNNFTIGYLGETAVCAIPAATLFFKATAFDIFLPRMLAGERIGVEQIAAMGLGGLAQPGTDACFPNATFGAGGWR